MAAQIFAYASHFVGFRLENLQNCRSRFPKGQILFQKEHTANEQSLAV